MHGAGRDVERYIRIAAPVAERFGALAIVIHFSTQAYPTISEYTLGIDRPGRTGWRAPEDMLYAEVEHRFDAVRAALGGEQAGYYLFGHSAGAQFVHRLLTFLPAPRVLGAVAANAGWYTLPAATHPRDHAMPYGLGGGPVAPKELARFFRTRFVVLLGERDTATAETDELVRGTPEAQAQGATRLERGRNYFAVAQQQAAALDLPFAWRLAVLPRAGHDAAQVIDSAGYLTFAPAAVTCGPTSAADAVGLVITEILADPPDGTGGDSNLDGTRDPSEDEFVEIHNRGRIPVCLAGWTLGDAEEPDRHVFPIGAALTPGATLVVFGGGVPTGRFHGAEVQWSEGGLSLSNAGDELTLRDASGAIACRISWGDHGGSPRGQYHWPAGLGIGRSLTRSPASEERWEIHPERAGTHFSPGLVLRRGDSDSK
ncbi:MAG: lamin tail domain-containing protein [Planctomycetota bacterium]